MYSEEEKLTRKSEKQDENELKIFDVHIKTLNELPNFINVNVTQR